MKEKLSKQETDLLLVIRTLREAIVEIGVKNSVPLLVTIRHPDFLNRQPINDEDVNSMERHILNTIKFVKYGRLVFKVNNGLPGQIFGDSYQQIYLGKVDWSSWALDKNQVKV